MSILLMCCNFCKKVCHRRFKKIGIVLFIGFTHVPDISEIHLKAHKVFVTSFVRPRIYRKMMGINFLIAFVFMTNYLTYAKENGFRMTLSNGSTEINHGISNSKTNIRRIPLISKETVAFVLNSSLAATKLIWKMIGDFLISSPVVTIPRTLFQIPWTIDMVPNSGNISEPCRTHLLTFKNLLFPPDNATYKSRYRKPSSIAYC